MTSLDGSSNVAIVQRPTDIVLRAVHAIAMKPILAAMFFSGIVLMFALPRIDFHADEAIYLRGVPMNVSNDSGLVFHLSYMGASLGIPTPISARWTSLLFGLVFIFSATRTMQILMPKHSSLIAWIVPFSIAISYQGVFSILRVRPEISWIAITGVCCWSLAELHVKDRMPFRILLLIALAVLPMNHILSWFACFYLAIYIVLFASQQFGLRMTMACVVAMAIGALLNNAIRSWVVQGNITWLPSVGSLATGPKPSLKEFAWNVYWNSPVFLNDSASTRNLWQQLLPEKISGYMSHCMVSTVLWVFALPLPLVMKTWRSRYVSSIPLFTLGLFYGSGYFNPTYAPLLILYGVCVAIYVAFDSQKQRSHRFTRPYAAIILVVSTLNGLSFLTTRVFNHGTATFFEMESLLRSEVAKMRSDSVIAIPERFLSITAGNPVRAYTLFKDVLPDKIDLVILDNYDFEMYRFVPDYEAKRFAIEELLSRHDNPLVLHRQVYKREVLRPDVQANQSIAACQGSWFFRNSVDYRVTLLRDSPSTYRPDYARETSQPNLIQR
jgi:hypothetical protein